MTDQRLSAAARGALAAVLQVHVAARSGDMAPFIDEPELGFIAALAAVDPPLVIVEAATLAASSPPLDVVDITGLDPILRSLADEVERLPGEFQGDGHGGGRTLIDRAAVLAILRGAVQ